MAVQQGKAKIQDTDATKATGAQYGNILSGIIGGIGQAVGGLGGGLISALHSKKQGERNYEYQKKLMELQHNQQLATMEKADYYQRKFAGDQFKIKMDAMQKAGINPYINDGVTPQGGESLQTAGGTPGGTIETGGGDIGQLVGNGISNAGKTAAEIANINANTAKIEKETENLDDANELVKTEIEEKLTNIEKTRKEIEKLGFDEKQVEALTNYTNAQAETELNKRAELDAKAQEHLAKAWNLKAGDLQRELGENPTFGDYLTVSLKHGGQVVKDLTPLIIGIAGKFGIDTAIEVIGSIVNNKLDGVKNKINALWRENTTAGLKQQFKKKTKK